MALPRGFCWVIGDIFQQYGTKYVGISRAIPLSNTNQLWGLIWGALVFGEFVHFTRAAQVIIFCASAVMIFGALAISSASAPEGERDSCHRAIVRECTRYEMNFEETLAVQYGEEISDAKHPRRWWDWLILAIALGVFVHFAIDARTPAIAIRYGYAALLIAIMLTSLVAGGWVLWKRTRFA